MNFVSVAALVTVLFECSCAPATGNGVNQGALLSWGEQAGDDILDAQQMFGPYSWRYQMQLDKSLYQLLQLYNGMSDLKNVIKKDFTDLGKNADGKGAVFTPDEIDRFMVDINEMLQDQTFTDGLRTKQLSKPAPETIKAWATATRENIDNANILVPDGYDDKVKQQVRQSLGLLLAHYRDMPDLLTVINNDLSEMEKNAGEKGAVFSRDELATFKEIIAELALARMEDLLLKKVYREKLETYKKTLLPGASKDVAEKPLDAKQKNKPDAPMAPMPEKVQKQVNTLEMMISKLTKENDVKAGLKKKVDALKKGFKPTPADGKPASVLSRLDIPVMIKIADNPFFKARAPQRAD